MCLPRPKGRRRRVVPKRRASFCPPPAAPTPLFRDPSPTYLPRPRFPRRPYRPHRSPLRATDGQGGQSETPACPPSFLSKQVAEDPCAGKNVHGS